MNFQKKKRSPETHRFLQWTELERENALRWFSCQNRQTGIAACQLSRGFIILQDIPIHCRSTSSSSPPFCWLAQGERKDVCGERGPCRGGRPERTAPEQRKNLIPAAPAFIISGRINGTAFSPGMDRIRIPCGKRRGIAAWCTWIFSFRLLFLGRRDGLGLDVTWRFSLERSGRFPSPLKIYTGRFSGDRSFRGGRRRIFYRSKPFAR